MDALHRIALAACVAAVLLLTATGCVNSSVGAEEPSPASTPTSIEAPDTIGQPLDEASAALTAAGFTVEVADVRENRSIWNRSNWVVVTQDVSGQTATLGVEKADDPACWEKATKCEWVQAFEFDATGNAESEQFTLDGGPARLTYTVTAGSPSEGKRTADIYFQDLAKHTESSSIDTIIYVDRPGSGSEDLGHRKGTYFLMTSIREFDVADVAIHVLVEQMRPIGG
ncbi:hypothetical protein [Microbacterium sp. 18062]|uniref:hypothetical protein n=1 Tax=Microbacterium sp. 18062 TaxID=2681410 RepID=UPI00135B70EF|nr:hypothetical protein [Microbacterium sp. 18062]